MLDDGIEPMRLAMLLAAAAAITMTPAPRAEAQYGPGGAIDPSRDCQTIRSCRFTKGGDYRGCISAYTCRSCRFVQAACTVNGRGRTCQELRCSW